MEKFVVGLDNDVFVTIPNSGREFRIRECEGKIDLMEIKKVSEDESEVILLWVQTGFVEDVAKKDISSLILSDLTCLLVVWMREAQYEKRNVYSYIEEQLDKNNITGQLRVILINQLNFLVDRKIIKAKEKSRD